MQAGRSAQANRLRLTMIYIACPLCGYTIDIFSEEDLKSPVRAKRMRYLSTRDQVCPNCVNAIGRCEKIEAAEQDIPLLRVTADDDVKRGLVEFCRKKGYAVATGYALEHFKEGK